MSLRRCSPLACVLAVLLLGACGSSSPGNSAKGLAPASSTVAGSSPAGAAITLGTICSCSGLEAGQLSALGRVAQAWASSVNAGGGINGHPVKLIAMDDGANPATSLQDAKQLVEQDHVMAIVGETSLVDATWASYVAAHGIPVVGGASFETPFLTNPDFFPSGTQLLVNQFGVIQLAKETGATHVGVMYCAESPVCASLVPLASGAAKLYGLQATATKVAATAPSYTATCLAAKSAGVNALYVADNYSVVQRFIDGCAQQGYKQPVVNTAAGFSNTWLADPNLNGTKLSAFDANPLDTSFAPVAHFQDALKRYAPGLISSSQFNPDAILPWAGGELFAAAAAAAHITPTSTGADVKKGLYALKNETLGGLAPPLTFTPGKPAFIACYFAQEIKGGKYTSLNGNLPTCLSAAQAKAIATVAKG